MIVDTDGETCVRASYSFGADTITRQYEVRVLQYGAKNSMGGPTGCLQFYIGQTSRVTTFNWNGLTGTDIYTYYFVSNPRPVLKKSSGETFLGM